MARGKKKGGKRRGDDSDDEDDDDDAPQQQQAPPQQGGGKKGAAPAEEEKKLSRKEKRMQKQNKKNANGNDDDGDDGDGDDDGHDAHMNGDIAALMSGKIKNTYGDDSEDSDDEPPLVKAKPAGKKKKGRAAVVALAALESSSEEEQEEENIEDDADLDNDDDDNDEEVEQVAFTLVDDDWGASKKKKKRDKKEKKHKKEKKKKKEDDDGGSDNEDMASKKKHKKHSKKQQLGDDDDDHSDDSSGNADVDKITQAVSDIKVDEPKQKSKFELQMEAALKKKEADKKPAPETAPPAKKEKAKRKGLEPELEPKPEPAVAANEEEEEDDDIMYGHKGDVAWTDKSHAIREAETATSDDDHDLHFGPDGKKLSNKERKKVAKARAAAEREAEYEATAAKASKEGAQFACSQTAVNEKDPQWQNSMDINIPNFSISAAGKILFKDAALTIGHGRRYGLVGANGRGKSTLLKMIASRDLKLPPRVDFLYVEQEVEADDTPAVEAVLRADKVRWDLMEEEKELMKAVDAGDESEVKIDRLQQVVDELTNMGADSAEAKARRILYGLGFTMEMQTKPTKMFSGGWRMRISLARALFVEPTLLMLDEPTNHLDLNAVIWLDEYLQKWKKTLFVVSHDQDFLNSVCQEVLHIEDLKLASYKGNYDSFKKAEKVKFQQHVKSWEKQEKRIKELKRQGQSRAKATETVKKSSKREAGARSQKKKNDAVAAGTEAAEAAQLIIRPKEYHVKLEFAEVAELSRPVMEVNNVHFRYSPKHPVIFDKVDFGIDMDSRICIVGPNGAG
jgi:ATP-binding cassette subfamily F protein 1